MRIRQLFTVLGASFCLSTGLASASLAASPAPSHLLAESAPTAELIAQAESGRYRGSALEMTAFWVIGISLAGGAIVGWVWLHLYQRHRQWLRAELARQEAKAFRERESVRNVLDILDYEEYRTFYINHPEDGRLIRFEAHDDRLKRALRSHDQMTKMRRGLDEIKRLAAIGNNQVNPKTLEIFQQYEDEEFIIEIALRDWFESFLGGMEYFELMIESGLVSAEDLKPFILYWIQLIGDRRFRRKGGSGFYDQLLHYIYWAGYTGVQSLFERFGYKVLPPPYSTHDLNEIAIERDSDTHRALCLAKAAYLVYEDREYVHDIVHSWLCEDVDNMWMHMSDREYVVDVIRRWQRERQEATTVESEIRDNFKYVDILTTDTQAFLLRHQNNIFLIFRGSQQLQDWSTNLNLRLREFQVSAVQGSVPPYGRVHLGFFDAWHSVEKIVVHHLQKWWTPKTNLWIAGHSLGGALANMSAISLECQGFHVSGMYTFGQPRIADWKLVNNANATMKDRLFRYANNNDVVPLIPPQLTPWAPLRFYGHMGNFRYFDFRGNLQRHSFMSQRWLDRLLGFVIALSKSGFDAVDDHKMEFYVANLQKAIDREAREAKLKQEQKLIRGEFTDNDEPPKVRLS